MEPKQSKDRPRIAVVLSGGGLNPLAALPIFDFLDRECIVEDLLAGCSGGGIVVALRGAGFSSEQIKTLIREKVRRSLFRRDWRTFLGLLHMPLGRFNKTVGLFKPDGVRWLFDSIFGELRLEDLKTKCVLQATDFHKGEGVRLERGNLARAVYASSAIYPFFPPIEIDGRLLFDGIYSGPLPLVHALAHDMDIIIAVDFTTPLSPDPGSFLDALVHVNRLFTKTVMQSQTMATVMLHHYEVIYIKVRFEKVINFWETEGIETIFESGKAALEAEHRNIMNAIQNWVKCKSDA